MDDFILEHFGLEAAEPELSGWERLVRQATEAQSRPPVKIALVGKYVQLEDAYLSVVEALRHSGFQHGRGIEIDWVDSETLDDGEVRARLHGADGILIPGGFGVRGIEGKITAARIAREQKIPFLGICLGMQMAVADFARHVVGMDGANSTEFDPETPYPVIDLLPEQKEVADMGGTMRLGADPIKLHPNTRAREIYGEAVIYERHRHRYEVNNFLRKRIEAAGLVCSGTSPDERLVEIIEIPDHPFFVASQYHPEFKSRPERPAPLFRDFVAAALERAQRAAPAGGRRRGAGRGPVRPASEAEKARQAETFADLCRILSPSWEEAACAERVAAELRGDGARGRGRRGGQPARAACAGAASARSCCARTWTRCRRSRRSSRCSSTTAGRTRNDGILGADNKSAVAMILEVARRCSVEGSPVGLELLFTVAEEVGLQGAKRFDASKLRSEFGYVFDHATPIGEIVTASPTLYRIEAEFHGKSAHAGLRPEAGRSAILAAAHAAVAHAARPHRRADDGQPRLPARRRRVHQRRPGARARARRGPLGGPRQGRGGARGA